MGPTCKHVTDLVGNVLKQVKSISLGCQVSCTKWVVSAGAIRGTTRYDNDDHIHMGDLYTGDHIHEEDPPRSMVLRLAKSGNESKKAQNVEEPRPARLRDSGEAKGRPSRIGRAGLKENPLQHFTRNTDQVHQNANNCPLPKGAGFPTAFLRSLMLRTSERVSSEGRMKAPVPSPSGKGTLSFRPKPATRAQIVYRFPGLQVIWIDGPRYQFWRCRKDCQFQRGYNHLYIGPQSPDTWLLFRIQAWLIGNLLCDEF